jgi:hypothetical protein
LVHSDRSATLRTVTSLRGTLRVDALVSLVLDLPRPRRAVEVRHLVSPCRVGPPALVLGWAERGRSSGRCRRSIRGRPNRRHWIEDQIRLDGAEFGHGLRRHVALTLASAMRDPWGAGGTCWGPSTGWSGRPPGNEAGAGVLACGFRLDPGVVGGIRPGRNGAGVRVANAVIRWPLAISPSGFLGLRPRRAP